jgi:hypothetical protein
MSQIFVPFIPLAPQYIEIYFLIDLNRLPILRNNRLSFVKKVLSQVPVRLSICRAYCLKRYKTRDKRVFERTGLPVQ